MANLIAARVKLSELELTNLKLYAAKSGMKHYQVVDEALAQAAADVPDRHTQMPKRGRNYRTVYHTSRLPIDRLTECLDCTQGEALYTAIMLFLERASRTEVA